MRVLAFTFEAPCKLYGGGLGIVQTMASLSSFASVDYVGPFFDLSEFPQIALEKVYFLEDNNTIPVKAWNLVRGVTTKYYQQWKQVIKKLDPAKYDVVFIDFSYNDFIMDWAHENNLKVVVRVHNIEQDMSANSARGKVHDKYWLRNVINGWLINVREKRIMNDAEHLIFLTKEDQNRACELYGNALLSRSSIVPVCMAFPEKEAVAMALPQPYILATGALYYGPNSEGIKWMISNVWKDIQKQLPGMSLLIAGRNPDDALKTLAENTDNCVLIPSPEDITPFFQQASLYLAPIFSGAGMKVKVAEALSYGLSVIGSQHALIGYEEAAPFVIEANTAEEFKKEILQFFSANHNAQWQEQCRKKFCDLYTMNRSAKDFEEAIAGEIE